MASAALYDRVKETSTTTGTGQFTLAGAVSGFLSFSSTVGSGNNTYYTIENPNLGEWEVGLGNMASTTLLTRTTVLASSNNGSAVNFSAGTKNVYVTCPASVIHQTATNGQSVLGSTFTITAANGTYQDTGLSVTLPAAGTYRVYADVRVGLGFSAGVQGYIVVKFFNSTDSADVTNSERLAFYTVTNSTYLLTIPVNTIVTVTASKTIKLYAVRNSATTWGRSTIDSDSDGRTIMGYVKVSL